MDFDSKTSVENRIMELEGVAATLFALMEGDADLENQKVLGFLARAIQAHCCELRDIIWPKAAAQ